MIQEIVEQVINVIIVLLSFKVLVGSYIFKNIHSGIIIIAIDCVKYMYTSLEVQCIYVVEQR